jgi:hypothetical protein
MALWKVIFQKPVFKKSNPLPAESQRCRRVLIIEAKHAAHARKLVGTLPAAAIDGTTGQGTAFR